jgi:hypothetical protein
VSSMASESKPNGVAGIWRGESNEGANCNGGVGALDGRMSGLRGEVSVPTAGLVSCEEAVRLMCCLISDR